MRETKVAVVVAALVFVCLGVFMVHGGMSRQDYLTLGLIGSVLAIAL